MHTRNVPLQLCNLLVHFFQVLSPIILALDLLFRLGRKLCQLFLRTRHLLLQDLHPFSLILLMLFESFDFVFEILISGSLGCELLRSSLFGEQYREFGLCRFKPMAAKLVLQDSRT